MERAEKKELVTTLNKVFQTTSVVVVAHNKGLTVNQVNDLRGRMAQAGATVKVAKNRLAKLALDGTAAAGIKDLFTGPTMVAYAADPVAAPKVAADFAKGNEKFVILGGALGKTDHGRRCGQGARGTALARPAQGKARWHDPDAGHPHRGRGPGACRPAGARDQRLCHQRQGCLTARLRTTWFKPIEREKVKWLI